MTSPVRSWLESSHHPNFSRFKGLSKGCTSSGPASCVSVAISRADAATTDTERLYYTSLHQDLNEETAYSIARGQTRPLKGSTSLAQLQPSDKPEVIAQLIEDCTPSIAVRQINSYRTRSQQRTDEASPAHARASGSGTGETNLQLNRMCSRRERSTYRKILPSEGSESVVSPLSAAVDTTLSMPNHLASGGLCPTPPGHSSKRANRLVNEWVMTEATRSTAPPQAKGGRPASLLRVLDAGRFVVGDAPKPPYFQSVSHARRASCSPLLESDSHSFTRRRSTEETRDGKLTASSLVNRQQHNDMAPSLTYVERVQQESIQSYRLYQDVTTALLPLHRRQPDHLEIDSVLVGRENVDRLRHNFNFIRYSNQMEIEDFIEKRAICRRAVSAHVCRRSTICGSSALLDVFVDARGKQSVLPTTGLCSCQKKTSLDSTWTACARKLAFEAERTRLIERIQNFSPGIAMTAFTKREVESLHAAIVDSIKRKPLSCSRKALYYKKDLTAFLVKRNDLSGALAHLDNVTPSDVVDAISSAAEVELICFVFGVLPE